MDKDTSTANFLIDFQKLEIRLSRIEHTQINDIYSNPIVRTYASIHLGLNLTGNK